MAFQQVFMNQDALIYEYFPFRQQNIKQMQQTEQKNYTYFKSIGRSNNLQFVSSYCAKPDRVAYSQGKYKYDSSIKDFIQASNHIGIDSILKQKMPGQQLNKNPTTGRQKQQKHFWPTDIMHDETGQTLTQLKTYIQNHKIDTYIKLNLSEKKYQNIKRPSTCQIGHINKNIQIIQKPKVIQPQAKTLKKQNKSVPVMGTNINNYLCGEMYILDEQQQYTKKPKKEKSQKMIKIDYEVIKISKSRTKNKNIIVHYDSNQIKKDIILNNQNTNIQNIKNFSNGINNRKKPHVQNRDIYINQQRMKRKYSHNIINNPYYDDFLDQGQVNNCCQCQCTCKRGNKKREKTQMQARTNFVVLDVHDKQYLTPNTSTYFNTINSVQQLNSDRMHYHRKQQSSTPNPNKKKSLKTSQRDLQSSKQIKNLQTSLKSQIITEYLQNKRNTKTKLNNIINAPQSYQQNNLNDKNKNNFGVQCDNYLNQQCQQDECSDYIQYDSNNQQDKINSHKNKSNSKSKSKTKRFQRNSGVKGNSLNCSIPYKDINIINNVMRMSGPL